MTEPLAILLEHTYVRTDMVYRLSLCEEFLDFAFFTDNATSITKVTVAHFSAEQSNPVEDITFLTSLSTSFWNAFTRDSFHSMFSKMLEELASLSTLPITIPIVLPTEHIAAVGKWS